MNSDNGDVSQETVAITPSGDEPPNALANEFDPEKFRLSQDYARSFSTEKVATRPAIRKPNRHDWFRVHPWPDKRMYAAVLELKVDNATYLVDPSVIPEIPGDVVVKQIVVCVTRLGVVFLWALKMPDASNRLDAWSESALVACQHAQDRWVRMVANMSAGCYDVLAARSITIEPAWPQESFMDLVKLAFQGRVITSSDHPVIRQLKGEG